MLLKQLIFEYKNKFTKGDYRELYWENTHKLLHKGYNGIKTGITSEAGPCLSSSLK